jgi:hypothetical protein
LALNPKGLEPFGGGVGYRRREGKKKEKVGKVRHNR